MMVRDGPLVVLRRGDVLRDPRVLVAAVVVAAGLLGVVEELPGKQRFHLRRGTSRQVSQRAHKSTRLSGLPAGLRFGLRAVLEHRWVLLCLFWVCLLVSIRKLIFLK